MSNIKHILTLCMVFLKMCCQTRPFSRVWKHVFYITNFWQHVFSTGGFMPSSSTTTQSISACVQEVTKLHTTTGSESKKIRATTGTRTEQERETTLLLPRAQHRWVAQPQIIIIFLIYDWVRDWRWSIPWTSQCTNFGNRTTCWSTSSEPKKHKYFRWLSCTVRHRRAELRFLAVSRLSLRPIGGGPRSTRPAPLTTSRRCTDFENRTTCWSTSSEPKKHRYFRWISCTVRHRRAETGFLTVSRLSSRPIGGSPRSTRPAPWAASRRRTDFKNCSWASRQQVQSRQHEANRDLILPLLIGE